MSFELKFILIFFAAMVLPTALAVTAYFIQEYFEEKKKKLVKEVKYRRGVKYYENDHGETFILKHGDKKLDAKILKAKGVIKNAGEETRKAFEELGKAVAGVNINRLQELMDEAVSHEEFERAAELRDKINKLKGNE